METLGQSLSTDAEGRAEEGLWSKETRTPKTPSAPAGLVLGAEEGRLHRSAPTVDDINPALPMIRNTP